MLSIKKRDISESGLKWNICPLNIAKEKNKTGRSIADKHSLLTDGWRLYKKDKTLKENETVKNKTTYIKNLAIIKIYGSFEKRNAIGANK